MSYFDGIKVGDRVYDMRFGWGEVVGYYTQLIYKIEVIFDMGRQVDFTMDGQYMDDNYQTLFWDKPEFIPPPRPKRKVKKTIEQWVNVHHANGKTKFSCACDTKEEADAFEEANIRNGLNRRIACVKLTGEYEVEE